MTIENRLKNLIVARYDNVITFTKKIGIPNSTFASIMARGIMNANVSSVYKICRALDISIDALMEGEIVTASELPERPTQDIKNEIDTLCTDLVTRSDISINGKPLEPSRASDLADLLQLSVEHIQNRQ